MGYCSHCTIQTIETAASWCLLPSPCFIIKTLPNSERERESKDQLFASFPLPLASFCSQWIGVGGSPKWCIPLKARELRLLSSTRRGFLAPLAGLNLIFRCLARERERPPPPPPICLPSQLTNREDICISLLLVFCENPWEELNKNDNFFYKSWPKPKKFYKWISSIFHPPPVFLHGNARNFKFPQPFRRMSGPYCVPTPLPSLILDFFIYQPGRRAENMKLANPMIPLIRKEKLLFLLKFWWNILTKVRHIFASCEIPDILWNWQKTDNRRASFAVCSLCFCYLFQFQVFGFNNLHWLEEKFRADGRKTN